VNRASAAVSLPAIFFCACAGAAGTSSPPPIARQEPPASPSLPEPVDAGATSRTVPEAREDAATYLDAAAPAASEGLDGGGLPPACPEGMVLIDGDYCTELETNCLRSTYAPQNKKTICWEFQKPTTCTGAKVHKRYCVDQYEYPNKKGELPRVMMNFPEAQELCAEQGKRICTESEWTMACEGPSYKPYPYGYNRDPKICNGDAAYGFPVMKKAFSKDPQVATPELVRLYRGVPSGSQPECVSDYGVFDMPGNADELAASETFTERSKFDSVTTGGPWLEGVRNQCRPKIYTHNEGFAYYYLSFRCCAEADGKPTDPRSPKQIRRNEKWRAGRKVTGFAPPRP
jgi:sulfatase modifying factor 1